MRDFPADIAVRSEAIEPAFAHMIGRWFAQTQYMKKTWGPHSAAHVDAWQNFWWGMESLSKLMIACKGASHAGIATQNHHIDVKRMIEQELGIEFSFMDENVNFRRLVKFELTFPTEPVKS